jgi:hypothetical protein
MCNSPLEIGPSAPLGRRKWWPSGVEGAFLGSRDWGLSTGDGYALLHAGVSHAKALDFNRRDA